MQHEDGWHYIGPEDAERLLKSKYDKQREHRNLWSIQYASDMEEGRWNDNNPQPIVLNTKGEVLDGQHRLEAVTIAKKPHRFYFVTVSDNSVYDVIDSGHTRQIKDRGRWTNDMIALARKILTLDTSGSVNASIKVSSGVTQMQVVEYLRASSDYVLGIVHDADKIRRKSGEVGSKATFAIFLHMAKVIYGDSRYADMFRNLESMPEISLWFSRHLLKLYQGKTKPMPMSYAPAIARFYDALIDGETIRMYAHKSNILGTWEEMYKMARKGGR